MKKLTMLDIALTTINGKVVVFDEWRRYECLYGTEYIPTVGPIHRLWISEKVLNRMPTQYIFTGSAGKTDNRIDYVLVLHNGQFVKVDPVKKEFGSNYAYQEVYTTEGVTIGEFMRRRHITMSDIKFIVEVKDYCEDWNFTEIEREVTIYGRTFIFKTVCDSIKAKIPYADPWRLHAHTQPETVYGHHNMTVDDLPRLDKLREENRIKLVGEQELTRNVLVNVLGEENARLIENFVNFGE